MNISRGENQGRLRGVNWDRTKNPMHSGHLEEYYQSNLLDTSIYDRWAIFVLRHNVKCLCPILNTFGFNPLTVAGINNFQSEDDGALA